MPNPESPISFAYIVLAEPALLEKIDRLFACNVGELSIYHTDAESLNEAEFENLKSEVSEVSKNIGLYVTVEVHEAMGLSTSAGDKLPTFSSDVFQLEIIGPMKISVIDIPGIFPGLTSKLDSALVRDMVLNYMRNPRSIMLAVIPANVVIATQEIVEIVEIARELNPDAIRTLRILTKPDLVDKGAEEKVIELIEGS